MIFAPYVSLLNLIDGIQLRPSASEPFTLAKESIDRILKWCGRHGLLGVLPQQVITVTLAARWEGDPTVMVSPKQTQFVRAEGGWHLIEVPDDGTVREIYLSDPEGRSHQIAKALLPVEREFPNIYSPPYVLLQTLGKAEIRHEGWAKPGRDSFQTLRKLREKTINILSP